MDLDSRLRGDDKMGAKTMKIILWVLFSLIAVALQLTIAPRLAILSVAPNLFLSGILAVAIWRRENKRDWLVLIPVFIFDLIAGRPFGFLTLILWLLFSFINKLGLRFFKKDDLPAILFLTVIGIIIFEATQTFGQLFLASRQLGESVFLLPFYFYAVLSRLSLALPISIFYNGLLVWVFSRCLHKIKIFGHDGSPAKF